MSHILENDFKQRVFETKWKDFECPKWYSYEKVPVALLQLSDIPLKEDIEKIASNTIYSFGNDHAGAYYRAIISALPFVVEIAKCSDSTNSRNCAWNILTDIYFSFAPDMESITEEIERKELVCWVKKTIENAVQSTIFEERELDILNLIEDIYDVMIS